MLMAPSASYRRPPAYLIPLWVRWFRIGHAAETRMLPLAESMASAFPKSDPKLGGTGIFGEDDERRERNRPSTMKARRAG